MPTTGSKPKHAKPSVVSPDTTTPPAQVSFFFDRLIVQRAIFEELPRAAGAEGEQRPAQLEGRLNLTLNIAQVENQPQGLVTLVVIVEPDLKWQPYRIEVAVAGLFRSDRHDPALFDEFCKRAVPSILFPYARQVIHNLTTDAAFGVVRVNPINLQTLLATNWKKTDAATNEPKPHR